MKLRTVKFVVELDENTERELRQVAEREDRSRRRTAAILIRRGLEERRVPEQAKTNREHQ